MDQNDPLAAFGFRLRLCNTRTEKSPESTEPGGGHWLVAHRAVCLPVR